MTDWRGSGTVLVIDDEEGVRIVAQSALERAGFTVLTAEDGGAGLELFRARGDEIVLVLLDLTMPRMSGGQVYRALIELRPGARVLLSSGYIDEDASDLLAGPGVAGFIQKPYRPAKLIEKIRAALEPGI
jgi:two-component system, cell cycle sensor histidine kinase and response regulator CckA